MTIDVTITLASLRQAIKLVEEAHAKGYDGSVAVLSLVKGGRSIGDTVVEPDGILLCTANDDRDFGRQSSASNVRPVERPAERPPRRRRPGEG